jgi:hypothetical protein
MVDGALESCADLQTTLESICDRLRKIFSFVEPGKANLSSYGSEIRTLLILACTEVEAQLKHVLKANEYPGKDKGWRTKDYEKLRTVMLLDEYRVRLTRYHIGELSPFSDWDEDEPTKSLPWYDAYNNVKHDRLNLRHKGTLAMAIDAVAALAIVAAAKYGPGFFHNTAIHACLHFSQWASCSPSDLYFGFPESERGGVPLFVEDKFFP